MTEQQKVIKPKVLIVEDEAIIASELKGCLQQLGYTILAHAFSGEKALELIAQESPDLILMDIVLKGRMDGIEAADIIRSRWEIPVVFITAHADQGRLERAKLVYPFGYIIKPFDDNAIKVAIEMALYVSKFDAERRKAEKALRESEERFDQLAEQSRTIAWEVDDQGLYTFVSHVSDVVLGYHPDELVGKKRFYDLHPKEGREAFKEAAFEVFRRKEAFQNLVNPIQAKDDGLVWVSTNGFPLLNADGTLRGYRGSDIDITERKRAEDAIRQSVEESRRLAQENGILAEIGRIIGSTLNIEDVFPLFSKEVKKILPFDSINIGLIDYEEQTVHVRYVAGIPVPERRIGGIFPLAGTLSNEVAEARGSVNLHFQEERQVVAKLPGTVPHFRQGLRSFLSVPLIHHNAVIGGLHLRSKKYEAYSEEDCRLAESVGHQIVGAIANAQLYAERQRSEEALKKSEEHYRKFVELSPYPILLHQEGKFIFINPAA